MFDIYFKVCSESSDIILRYFQLHPVSEVEHTVIHTLILICERQGMGGFCVYFYSAAQRSRATSQCFMFCYGKWGFNGYGDLLKHANIYGNKAKKKEKIFALF